VVVVLDAAARAGATPVSAIGGRLDMLLGRWPVAAMSLLCLLLAFGLLIVGKH
jgi:hypothetical protein